MLNSNGIVNNEEKWQISTYTGVVVIVFFLSHDWALMFLCTNRENQ